ncbi:MFS general substrate transporter [Stipitochalara longipes BDJ]|nr:MFS general substrate transporter [Stipitochalara longipes BDJ]
MTKKIAIVLIVLNTVLNSTISSALPSGNAAAISTALKIRSSAQLVLLTSIYLLGYVFGPLVFGPLSEIYGRKTVLLPTFFCFTVLTLGCALAPNWGALVVLRLLTGLAASAPITIVGGVYADIYELDIRRGRAIAAFMAGNTFGPILGPLISGFAGGLSWRWPFWIALALAGVSWILLWFLPETYAPIILARANKIKRTFNKEQDATAAAVRETNGPKHQHTIKAILVRPIRLFFCEPIVFCVCLYLALAFGIFYLFFEAYPIIFQGIYNLSPGISALALLPIGIGALLACAIFFYYDSIVRQAQASNKPWSQTNENRLPLACLGGPILGLSLFWLAWTANTHIHPIVPMLAGLPFGIGFLLIFMALTNYLTDLYADQAASAMAALTCTRSIFGAGLPFATDKMYDTLGVHWAGSLLGFLALALGIVPWVFWKWGGRIRGRRAGE